MKYKSRYVLQTWTRLILFHSNKGDGAAESEGNAYSKNDKDDEGDITGVVSPIIPRVLKCSSRHFIFHWKFVWRLSKSYQREGQPRKTENKLTNDRWRRYKMLKPNPNHIPPNPSTELNTKSSPKNGNQRKKLRKA